MEEPISSTQRMSHKLRPHHLFLLTVLMCMFKDFEGKLPPPFLLHLYRILIPEISEVSEPRPYKELISAISSGPLSLTENPGWFIKAIKETSDISSTDRFTVFFTEMNFLIMGKSEEEGPEAPFARRSLFGYFARRCYCTSLKLSFAGASKLIDDYVAWRNGDLRAGYQAYPQDPFDNDTIMCKTVPDMRQNVQTDSYTAFQSGLFSGDEMTASDNLRKFFEQNFHDNADSGFRQHALLHLTRMHYLRLEFSEARRLLTEAIALCRTKGDKHTLMHCMALSYRLPTLVPDQKPVLNEVQPEVHPLEILFDVKKLSEFTSEQPLSASFRKLFEAIGLYDHYIDAQGHPAVEEEQFGQHAVQSVLWSSAGRNRLSAIEENIVTAFTQVGAGNDTRFVVTLNRAYKRARDGEYERALAMLMDADVWRGLSNADYQQWASQIFQILLLRADRRGMTRQIQEVLLPRRPEDKDYSFQTPKLPKHPFEASLNHVIKLRMADQAPLAIESLLKVLWHTEFRGQYGLYRIALTLLADIELEFGMTKRCRRIMEEIMHQTGDDIELRALTSFTLARCIMAAGENSPESLREALPCLELAQRCYARLEMHGALADVFYFKSVLYHNLGMVTERDTAAQKHLDSDAERKKAEVVVVDDDVVRIWQAVADVGAALSARR